MSRSGYSNDCENLGLWRQAVARAIHGKRGQSFLREMADALDAMPVKELIAGDVVRNDNGVCAIGSVALARKLDVTEIDIYDGESVGKSFGVARALACEIAWENDENGPYRGETPRSVGRGCARGWPGSLQRLSAARKETRSDDHPLALGARRQGRGARDGTCPRCGGQVEEGNREGRGCAPRCASKDARSEGDGRTCGSRNCAYPLLWRATMSEWKQAAARRRDERNAKPDDASTLSASKRKDTKRWCRGKVGVEHRPECRRYNETKRQDLPGLNSWRVLVCSECGKELATWYGTKKNKPEWVTA